MLENRCAHSQRHARTHERELIAVLPLSASGRSGNKLSGWFLLPVDGNFPNFLSEFGGGS
ncbi:hypothetical protein BCON_0056g00400 [Botryotinia convoluta]|uniref:Uncharacterized protein n=1 Tax=Botryotinia convoluta TaxID=54673 RepID=A0A4Z1I9T7_9HELO|nr:hypothetical protein BCON_0056g00400 [Botryotinia convoluta]